MNTKKILLQKLVMVMLKNLTRENRYFRISTQNAVIKFYFLILKVFHLILLIMCLLFPVVGNSVRISRGKLSSSRSEWIVRALMKLKELPFSSG